MELQTISERTHLPLRKLRYVIDHRLLPGLRVKIDGTAAGRPRYFAEEEAFAIACAAVMLIGGLRREAVIQCIASLAELTWDGEPYSKHAFEERRKNRVPRVLQSVHTGSGKAVVMLGDGLNIRVLENSRDSGWRQPQTLALLSDEYQPMVIVQVDLARLRDQLRQKTQPPPLAP